MDMTKRPGRRARSIAHNLALLPPSFDIRAQSGQVVHGVPVTMLYPELSADWQYTKRTKMATFTKDAPKGVKFSNHTLVLFEKVFGK